MRSRTSSQGLPGLPPEGALAARRSISPAHAASKKARHALGRRDAERLLGMIVAVRPAVEALTDLAGAVLDDTPLPELWPRIRDFVREWCRVPPGPPDAAKLLDEAIADVCASRAASGLRGREAVDRLPVEQDVPELWLCEA